MKLKSMNQHRERHYWIFITLPLLAVAFLLTITQPALAQTRTIVPGYTTIANQRVNNKKVGFIFKNLNTTAPIPNGSIIWKWNNALQTWDPCNTYDAVTKQWTYPDQELAPGEGAFIYNPSSSSYMITIPGGPNTDSPSVYCSLPGLYMVSRKTDVAALSYIDITGCTTPIDGELVYRFDEASQSYTLFSFLFGTWFPSDPTAASGQPVFWFPNGGGPVVQNPCCVTIVKNPPNLILSWTCSNCTLEQATNLNGPWTTVPNCNGAAVASPCTTAIGGGQPKYYRLFCP